MVCNFDLDLNDLPGTFPLDPTSIVISNISPGLTVVNLFDGTVDVSSLVVGVYTFDYTIDDTMGNTSNTATVTITITPAVIPPVAIDDFFGSPGPAQDLLANDIANTYPLDPTCVVISNISPSLTVIDNDDGTVAVDGVTPAGSWNTTTLQDLGLVDITFTDPQDITISPDGLTLYVADATDGAIYEIDLATSVVSTLTNATPGVFRMSMHYPTGNIIAISRGTYVPGNIGNGVCWEITPGGVVTVVEATLALPRDVAINDFGDIYFGEQWDFGGFGNRSILTRKRMGIPATSPTELVQDVGLTDFINHMSFSDDLTLQLQADGNGHFRYTIEPGYTTFVRENFTGNVPGEVSNNGGCVFEWNGQGVMSVRPMSPLTDVPSAIAGANLLQSTVDGVTGVSRMNGAIGWHQHPDGRLFAIQNPIDPLQRVIRVLEPVGATFDYTVCDTMGNVSNVATVTNVIACLEEDPTATNEVFAAVEGFTLSVNITSNNTRGTWAIDQAAISLSNIDPNLTIVPGGAYGAYLITPAIAGSFTFDYTIVDTQGNSSTATVTVNSVAAIGTPPDMVPGGCLVEWLDSATITPQVDNTPLPTWVATVGNDAIAAPTTPTYRTASFNGLPAVEYINSVNSRHTFADPFGGAAYSEFTVILAFEDFSGNEGMIIGNRDPGSGFNYFVDTGGNDLFISYAPANNLTFPFQPNNTPVVSAIRAGPGGKSIFQDTALVASNLTTVANGAGVAWDIAGEPAVGGNWNFSGLIAEIAVFNCALSDADVISVLNYYKQKYSI